MGDADLEMLDDGELDVLFRLAAWTRRHVREGRPVVEVIEETRYEVQERDLRAEAVSPMLTHLAQIALHESVATSRN